MGTRSLTHFMEDRGPGKRPQVICTVYRKMDGYPTMKRLWYGLLDDFDPEACEASRKS